MTYVFYRDADSNQWAVSEVSVNGGDRLRATFDSARAARAYTMALRDAEAALRRACEPTPGNLRTDRLSQEDWPSAPVLMIPVANAIGRD